MKDAYHFLREKLDYDDILVVGVSGGPDSMALLNLINEFRKEKNIQIVCAHVNHNVRKESNEEERFVASFCKKYDIVFETMKIEGYSDDNFHNEARSRRYQYFEKLIDKYHAKYLLTAHHGDDLIETILMRIVRGSTLHGYSGFQEMVERNHYIILRPLIHVTKQDIYEYLKEKKIQYVIDNSNQKDVYTRNRFRKYIVSEFKKEDPMIHEKFYKFSKTLLEYSNYIDKIVIQEYQKIVKKNNLYINEFLQLDSIIQKEIIYKILAEQYQDDLMLITDRHVELIFQLILSSKANSEIHLPNNIRVIKSYQNLEFLKELSEISNYKLELIDCVRLQNGKSIKIIEETDSNSNFVCRLSKEDVKFPLYVRNRIDGDIISIKGLNGHKKIKDIFINEKIPQLERNNWPIVVDSNGVIVWLPGLKKTKFDKTKEEKYDIILKYD